MKNVFISLGIFHLTMLKHISKDNYNVWDCILVEYGNHQLSSLVHSAERSNWHWLKRVAVGYKNFLNSGNFNKEVSPVETWFLGTDILWISGSQPEGISHSSRDLVVFWDLLACQMSDVCLGALAFKGWKSGIGINILKKHRTNASQQKNYLLQNINNVKDEIHCPVWRNKCKRFLSSTHLKIQSLISAI
jgi:hypothetical protein